MNVTKQIESFFEENEEPLNDRQKYLLKREWGDGRGNYGDLNLPFQAYEWEKVKYQVNPIARLTFPFFILYIIILTLLIRPIHWFITGSWWFKESWNGSILLANKIIIIIFYCGNFLNNLNTHEEVRDKTLLPTIYTTMAMMNER